MQALIKDKKIVVLAGGVGSERDVSLASGKSVADAMCASNYNAHFLEVKSKNFELPPKTDLAFNMIHGSFGEDGELQKILEEKKIPYTGENNVVSARCFDKIVSKQILLKHGLPCPKYVKLYGKDAAKNLLDFGLPAVVKTPREGSSVGVHIVKKPEQIQAAIDDCLKYADDILAESYVEGRELTVGVIGTDTLPIVEIKPPQDTEGFYDMATKYPWLSGKKTSSQYICPAEIEKGLTKEIQNIAVNACRAHGVEIYSRVDILLDKNDNAWILEINTIPGMTESSLLPMAAKEANISFVELLEKIAVLSLQRKI